MLADPQPPRRRGSHYTTHTAQPTTGPPHRLPAHTRGLPGPPLLTLEFAEAGAEVRPTDAAPG